MPLIANISCATPSSTVALLARMHANIFIINTNYFYPDVSVSVRVLQQNLLIRDAVTTGRPKKVTP